MLEPTLLLMLALPQSDAPQSPRERLDALIESTNGLEHFSVEYSAEGTEMLSRVRIDYKAPDSIRLRMEAPQGLVTWGRSGSMLWMQASGSGGAPTFSQVDLLDRGGACEEAIAIIGESGWTRLDGPEVELSWGWKFNPDLNKTDLEISVSTGIAISHDHVRLLGWLHNIEHLDGELTLEDDALVHRSTRAEAHVDGVTGFLRRLIVTSAEGVNMEVTLEALDLDVPPEDSCFVPPQPDLAAIDQSITLRNRATSRPYVRRAALQHVHRLLDKGQRQFDQQLHDDLERFFGALYDSKLTGEMEEWMGSTKQGAIEFSAWIREQRQAGHSLEHLEAAAEKRRGELEATIDSLRADLAQIIPTDFPNYPESRHWKAIRDLEDEVLLVRFNALVANPILDDFDARVDGALDG